MEIFPAFSFLLGEICTDRKHTPCTELPAAFKPACGLMRHTANDFKIFTFDAKIEYFSAVYNGIFL